MEPHVPLLEFIDRFARDGYGGRFPLGRPVPFLAIRHRDLAAGRPGDGDDRPTRSGAAGARERTGCGFWDSPLFAAPLVKPEGCLAKGLVTLGRGRGSDILLRFPAISRFHAYFVADGSGRRMAIWDARSKNGTQVDGESLVPGEGLLLRSGGIILLGGEVRVLFFSTADFLGEPALPRD